MNTLEKMKNTVYTLLLSFKNDIAPYEINLLRGALLNLLGQDADILFHNHLGDGFRYSYPLIQYKRIKQKAAVVCINEGVEAVGNLLAKGINQICLGDRVVELEIQQVAPRKTTVQVWDSVFKYRINRWLPLNKENYERFKTLETIAERTEMLEKLLTANLLSFLKGIGIRVEKDVVCNLMNISDPYCIKNKGVGLMAFDVEFRTNLSLPDYIGIGKNASIGCGVLTKIYNQDKNTK